MSFFSGRECNTHSMSSEEEVEDNEENNVRGEKEPAPADWVPGTDESEKDRKRTKQRLEDKKKTTSEKIHAGVPSVDVNWRQNNSVTKKNSSENPSKGKVLVRPSTQKTFIQVILTFLFGLKTTIHPLLETFWEIHLNQLLNHNPIPPFVNDIMNLMSCLILTLAKSPSELAVVTYLSGQRDTELQSHISAEIEKELQDFFEAFRIVLKNDDLYTTQNNNPLCSTSQSLSSNSSTLPISVPRIDQVAAGSSWADPQALRSPTEQLPQPRGWMSKTRETSSVISWVDPVTKYIVESHENNGDWIVKTEVFSKSQSLCFPQWRKHPLHRSEIELTTTSTAARLLKRYTDEVENMWVDKNSGVLKVQQVTKKTIPRILPGPTFDQPV